MTHQHEQDRQLIDQNQQLTAEIKRRVSQLAAINTVAASVSQILDMDHALQTALEAVLDVIPVEAAAISLVDTADEMLVLRAQRGLALDFVSEPMRIPLGEGLSGQAIHENRVLVSTDLNAESGLAVPGFIQEQIRAQVLVPMHARGRVTGVLSVMSHAPYAFADEELDMLRAIADQIGIALENARLYEQSRLQEQRLHSVIQSAADPIIATDYNGRIRVLNKAALHFLERAEAELLGKPLLEAPLFPPFLNALQQTTRDGADFGRFDLALDAETTYTAVVSRLGTSDRLATSDREQGSDEMSGWVIVLRDISHARQAERARLEFMQNLAHDLRNPLGITLSSVSMLRDFITTDDPDLEEIYSITLEAINRMHHLIDDLLNLETIENGGDFELGELDVCALLGQALRDMRPALEAKQHTHAIHAAENLPRLHASYTWLYRAVTNYLNNAVKYTPPGGHIVVEARQAGDEVLIEVQDNGPGIPPESQVRLFERFYRVSSVHEEVRGSGLGLAIVKSIAEAHQGRVYIKSTPGQGSHFGIALPVR
ncbi:MAG: GAF domain-containing protein [Anaerolineae bacterium]|nr:GAF domain-containing protein [Anaerolineae bacterium]